MSDDAQVKISISADMDSSLQSAANAAKEELEELGAQAGLGASSFGALAAMMEEQGASATVTTVANEETTVSLEGLTAVADVAKATVEALGVSLTAAAAVAFGDSVLSYAADTEHMADVLGLSTDQLQALHFAAQENGVSIDEADNMMRRFTASLGAAEEGTGAQAKALQDLGLNAKELAGDPADAISKVATALLGVTDPAQRAHDEVVLFGRAGEDLNAMLLTLSGGFDGMLDHARAAGAVLGPELSREAEETDDKLSILWTDVKVGAVEAGEAVGKLGSAVATLMSGAAPPADPEKLMPWADPNKIDISGVIDKQAEATSQEMDNDRAYAQAYQGLKQREAAAAEEKAQRAAAAEARANAQMLAADQRAAAEAASYAAHAAQQQSEIDVGHLNTAIDISKMEVAAKRDALEQQVADGEITKAQMLEQMRDLVEQEDRLDLQRLVNERENHVEDFAEWERLTDEISKAYEKMSLDLASYGDQIAESAKQSADQVAKSWKQANDEILGAEDKFIGDMLSGRKTLEQSLLGVAQDLITKELEDDAKYWTQMVLQALEGTEKVKMTEQGGALLNLFGLGGAGGGASGSGAQAAQTAALTANTAALTGHAAVTTADTAATTVSTAATTTNTATQATGILAWIDNTVATIANTIATDAGDIGSFLGFASGADNIPHDMVAQIHKGEMIVPAGPAQALRERGIGGYDLSDAAKSFVSGGSFSLDRSSFQGGNVSNTKGGDTHFHTDYHTSWSGRDPVTPQEFFRKNQNEIVGELKRLVRNGSLAF